MVDGRNATAIVIAAGQVFPNVDFALDRAGSISGHVFKADGMTVIKDVQISVEADGASEGANGNGTYVSQADGSYTINGLAPGKYRILANSNRVVGYVARYYNNRQSWDTADLIDVAAGQTTGNIDFALGPGGAISGHIFKGDGVTVINDWEISVHAHGLTEGASSIGTNASQVDGGYTIGGLAPGLYKVEGNNNRVPGYVAKFYDDSLAWHTAQIITVTAGQAVPGIDFALAPGGGISGHVYAQDGVTPIVGASVNIMDTHFESVAGRSTRADGKFTIGGLPAGSYYLAVDAAGFGSMFYRDGYDDPHAVAIPVVPPTTTTNIDFVLSPEATASGAVYQADGSTPIVNAKVMVWPLAGGLTHEAQTGAGGAFTIHGLATGVYVARAEAAAYAAEFYRDAGDWWSATPFSVTQPANTFGIVFTLAPLVEAEVSPHSEGSLVYIDPRGGSTAIRVPANAVTTTVTLKFSPAQNASVPPNFKFAGHAFELNAFSDGQQLPGFVFLLPVAVTIEYTDLDVLGIDESSLTLNFWSVPENKWIDAAGSCTPASTYAAIRQAIN